jgi:pyrimidine operon attenuation protein/uracil phosphoribosyltransferase
MAIYPVPAKDIINVEFVGIENYQINLYNSLGQKIKTAQNLEVDKLALDVSNIDNGLYFLEFIKDGQRDTRKIIVKH